MPDKPLMNDKDERPNGAGGPHATAYPSKASAGTPAKTKPAAKKEGESWIETVKTVVYALLIALVIRTFLFQPFNIPSSSMEATLLVGDYLLQPLFLPVRARPNFGTRVRARPGPRRCHRLQVSAGQFDRLHQAYHRAAG